MLESSRGRSPYSQFKKGTSKMNLQDPRTSLGWRSGLALLLLLVSSLAANAQNVPNRFDPLAPASSIWTFEKTPNIGQNNILLALSADSPSDIWSVGDLVSLNFNGSTWKAFPMVNFGNTSMHGVSAISSTNVWAVGEDFEGSSTSVIQNFDGAKWSVVSSPHFTKGDALNGVQAISSTDIFAVGSSSTDSPDTVSPLIEHFDGNQWSAVTTPPVSTGASLNQIAIISSTDMWAVGQMGVLDGQQPTQPFAMHFDGTQWSIVTVPAPANSFFNTLASVTAIASNDVWAVGSTTNNTATVTLTEHWDGNTWKTMPSPNAGREGNIQGENQLLGVSAISTSDVWACGFFVDVPQGSTLHFLVEHWNGKRWSLSATPATGTGFDSSHAVLAFPTGDVFVAGSAIKGNSQLISIVLHTTKGL
jgi:hypothetical protein